MFWPQLLCEAGHSITDQTAYNESLDTQTPKIKLSDALRNPETCCRTILLPLAANRCGGKRDRQVNPVCGRLTSIIAATTLGDCFHHALVIPFGGRWP